MLRVKDPARSSIQWREPPPWFRRQFEQLMALKEKDRVPHAMLWTGSEGTGRNGLASVFIRSLMCHNPLFQSSCGCQSCYLMDKNSHPDVMDIMPEKEEGMIKIDQIRALNDFIQLPPQFRKTKCVTLSPAESLNAAANNALLKVLEEPPSYVHFILIGENVGRLPQTIRSRCIPYRLVITDFNAVSTFLEEQGVDSKWMLDISKPMTLLKWKDNQLLETFDAIRSELNQLSGDLMFSESLTRLAKHGLKEVVSQLEHLVLIRLYDFSRSQIIRSPTMAAYFSFLTRLYEYKTLLQQHVSLNETLHLENLLIDWLSLMQYDIQ